MAYSTGTVATASGLLTSIDTFLTGSCGWTLIDTLSGQEKVFYSDGENGDANIYVRFKAGVKDYNQIPSITYWQNQDFPNAPYDHLNVTTMQHYNPATNVSTNENTGKIGPWKMLFSGSLGSTTANVLRDSGYTKTALIAHKNNGTITNTTTPWFSYYQSSFAYGADSCYTPHLGPILVRTMYITNKSLFFVDLLHRRYGYKTSTNAIYDYSAKPVFACDQNGDACIFYLAGQVGTTGFPVGQRFAKYNLDTDVNSVLALPPPGSALAQQYSNASIVWDGQDAFYMAMSISNGWYKYVISTDTWSTLTVVPVAGNNSFAAQYVNYISRNSAIGISQSWTSDRIYIQVQNTTVANASIYYWDVTAATWTLASAGSTTNNPGTQTFYGDAFTWDGGTRFSCTHPNNKNYGHWKMDTNVWTRTDNALLNSTSYLCGIKYLDTHQNQMVVDKANTTYHLFGDKNHLKVALVHNDAKNYFYYVGEIDSFYSTQKVRTTAGVSAGPSVAISVSGVFDQYQVGEPLYIYTPDTGGNASQFTLSASGINSLTAGTLVSGYASGSIIGVDPQPTVSLINFWDAVHVTHTPFGPGCFTNNNTNPGKFSQEVAYNLLPQTGQAMGASFKGSRGHYQLYPVIVAATKSVESLERLGSEIPKQFSTDIDNSGQSLMPSAFIEHVNNGTLLETRGQLHGVYASKKTTAPEPISGDEMQIGSNSYLVFNFQNLFGPEGKNLTTIIGPK